MQATSGNDAGIIIGSVGVIVSLVLWALAPTPNLRFSAIGFAVALASVTLFLFVPGLRSWPLPQRLCLMIGAPLVIIGAFWGPLSSVVGMQHAARAHSKSEVRGEIVLFEPVSIAEHPEMYAKGTSDLGSAILTTLKCGDSYDVGLHIESLGEATRLHGWHFVLVMKDGTEVQCHVDSSAWPPPKSWHQQFPDAMTLMSAEALYFKPAHVYAVYCQVRIKSYLDDTQRSLLELDSLEASATDHNGRVAMFRIKRRS